jgi:hypothetical protein
LASARDVDAAGNQQRLLNERQGAGDNPAEGLPIATIGLLDYVLEALAVADVEVPMQHPLIAAVEGLAAVVAPTQALDGVRAVRSVAPPAPRLKRQRLVE